MVDARVVRDRLAAVRLNARRLATVVEAGRERFVAEEDLYLKAERSLHLCIQAILDVGTHILAGETSERPAGYENVVPALGTAGLLEQDLVARLSGIAGMRNILVHDYLKVDHEQLFDNISRGLTDFQAFVEAIERRLGSP